MDTLISKDEDNSSFNLAPIERLQLCFNILPKGFSFFHYIHFKELNNDNLGKDSVTKATD